MYKYQKILSFPVDIKKKDVNMAKCLLSQLGGANGELGAALRYFSQKYTMPCDRGRALLNDIATEELGHVEMISTMIHQLLSGATKDEIKEAGLSGYFTDHRKGIFPVDASGSPFTAAYFQVTGDPIADLVEDMAAESKARVTYENLIELTEDEDLINVLLFLRQREVVHFNRFEELYNIYKTKGY
ncbi:MAG: manganese catalase family protein [bacterium]